MPNSTPRVSIIIPSYNHAAYIDHAIQSVLDQTYENTELIVVDDGSKDNSHQVISRYEGKDGVVLLLNKKNQGQGAVIQQALEVATGEFISFLPSDDWYLPEKTELQIRKFLECSKKTGVVYGKGHRYFEDKDSIEKVTLPMFRGEVLRNFIEDGDFVYPVTPMFRRKVFDTFTFDNRLRAEGEAIYIKVAVHWEFDYVDEIVGVMRDHSENTGKDKDLRTHKDVMLFWQDFFARDDIPSDIKRLKGSKIARTCRSKGIQRVIYFRDYKNGRQILWTGIRHYKKLLTDKGVIAALALCFLPRFISNAILNASGKPSTETP